MPSIGVLRACRRRPLPGAGSDRRGRARARSTASSSWTMSPGKVIKLGAEGVGRAGLHEIMLARNDHRGNWWSSAPSKAWSRLARCPDAPRWTATRKRLQFSDREASQSAATDFRSMKPEAGEPLPRPAAATLYGLSPVVEVKGGGTLVIERIDVQGERQDDHAHKSKSLTKGQVLRSRQGRQVADGGRHATRRRSGSRRTTFRVDPCATAGSTPIVGRLLRL